MLMEQLFPLAYTFFFVAIIDLFTYLLTGYIYLYLPGAT